MTPIVSVIIPAYNTEHYIQKAIGSVLEQSLQNLEIVIVDDASTDSTLEVIESIQDPRVKLFKNAHNMGAGASRNRAIQESQGEWIAVLDSDDWYAPQRLEYLINFARDKGADMVADDLHIVEDGHTKPRTTLFEWSGEAPDKPLKISPIDFVLSDIENEKGLKLGFSKPLFRRQFLIENNIAYEPKIKVTQDFWIDLECLVNGANFWLVPNPYYYYRTRQGALTSSTKITMRLDQECEAIENFIDAHAEYLHQNSALENALRLKFNATAKYRDYYSVVELIRDKQFPQASWELFKRPRFFEVLASRLPGIVQRRIAAVLDRESVYYLFN